MHKLDTRLAYQAMFRFLEKYDALTHSDDIAALLGSMSMAVFQDAMPADPAMWEDWQEAVQDAVEDRSRLSGKSNQVFRSILRHGRKTGFRPCR